jgi:hypothetical protein
MSTPPTLATSGPGGASPINGGSPTVVPFNDARVTQLGCVPITFNQFSTDYIQNSSNASWTPQSWAIEFDHYGDDLAVRFRNASSGGSLFWVFVDGRPATAAPVTSSAASGGSLFYERITFATVDYRRIRVYLYLADFGGIDLKPTQSINPTAKVGPKFAIYGDSYVEATGATNNLLGMSVTIARLLGVEMFIAGQGGTGYVATGGGGSKAPYTDSARIAKLTAAAPDYIIVFGSSNDDATSSATVGTAATSVYSQLLAGLPLAKLIVVGPPSLGNSPAAGRLANRTAIQTAALVASNGLGFVDPLSDAASALWVFGTGSSTAPAGNGNADYFNNGAVAGHLTQAGHDYYARRIAVGIRTLLEAA